MAAFSPLNHSSIVEFLVFRFSKYYGSQSLYLGECGTEGQVRFFFGQTTVLGEKCSRMRDAVIHFLILTYSNKVHKYTLCTTVKMLVKL